MLVIYSLNYDLLTLLAKYPPFYNMNDKHWLSELLEHIGENPTGFARSIGLKRETRIMNVLKGRNNITADLCKQIKQAYPEVRMQWLMTGEGRMFEDIANKEDLNELGIHTTYLLPQSAMGGSLTNFPVDGVALPNCEAIISPIKDVDFAITVYGESMSPEYPNGSRILIKRINHRSFIEWGKTYVLDTCNGVIVKNVRKCQDESKITCQPINPNFDSFDVPFDDIYAMYKVLMCLSAK